MVEFYRLCLDCSSEKVEVLENKEMCERFMTALSKVLDMHEVGRLFYEAGSGPAGVSGVTLYVESGAQLHTWPEEGRFYLDVTSCKRFEPGLVVELVENWFGADVEVKYASA